MFSIAPSVHHDKEGHDRCHHNTEDKRQHEHAVARFVGGVGIDEATVCTDLSAMTNGRKHRDFGVVASWTMTEFFHGVNGCKVVKKFRRYDGLGVTTHWVLTTSNIGHFTFSQGR